MSEDTSDPGDPEVPASPDPLAPVRTRSKRRAVWRWGRRLLALCVALVATLVVFVFTVDLGRVFPKLRTYAEAQGSKFLQRPLHLGRISMRLTPGDFEVDDVLIEGLAPTDRPYFQAKRVYLHVPLWELLRKQIIVELEVSDFNMVVEAWAGGRTNVPHQSLPESTGKKTFNTTTRFAYARRGTFTYEDHATPWRVVAPNLEFEMVRAENLKQYVGKASTTGGVVQIQNYLPMTMAMNTRFVMNGPAVTVQHMDLTTDGTMSHVSGLVEFGKNWPRQTYNVSSTIDFPTMKKLFFANETWTLGGAGEFNGQFKLFKEGGRELAGEFTSKVARVNDLDFQNLHGDLIWTNTKFAVTHADSDMLGGHTRFDYSVSPLGTPTGATAHFMADYVDTDLFDLNRLLDLRGLRLAGVATGSLDLEWLNGHFGTTRRGTGHTTMAPAAGVRLAPTTLPAVPLPAAPEPVPFESTRRSAPLTLGADLHYWINSDGVTFDKSWAATPLTYIAFSGRMAKVGASQFPFDVTSHDWQESDRLLTSIMTAITTPTGAVEVGGRGTFHGVMTGNFSDPTITGHFDSEATHVWAVTWGRAVADVVIHKGYVDIANSRIGDHPESSSIDANGRFSLGFRKDNAEEIKAQVHLANWPLADLRHAFQLDDWPMEGTMAALSLDLTGKYKEMFGSGQMRIDKGRAWKEGFDWATGDLSLEGTGIRVSRIEMHKSDGIMHGGARVGWNGTYDFTADGNIPVESLDNFQFPSAPLSGRLQFTASGGGLFTAPVYSFQGSIDDLFVGDEGIGVVRGRFVVRDNVLSIGSLLAASSRVTVDGNGTIALDEAYTSNLRFVVQGTSIDPYLKFVMASDVSPYTRAIVGGSLLVKGPLARSRDLSVDATIDDATLTLFDYDLKNDGQVHVTFEGGKAQIGSLKLHGADTNLELTGGADLNARTIAVNASGSASLSILQLLRNFQGITASGSASLNASLAGSFDRPQLTGEARIADGRFRPLDSPHGLEAVNGRILFAENAITLKDLKGRVANGDVDFGGGVALDGYTVSDVNLTARGRSMRLRYPTGFTSTVDMNLALAGTLNALRLDGTVDVLRMTFLGQADPSASLLEFSAGAVGGLSPLTSLPSAVAETTTPLALNIHVTAPPGMTFINNNTLRVQGAANLYVGGTFSQPLLSGSIEIENGYALIFGNRYYIREGSVEFTPDRPEPVFNIVADSRPRVAGQTYLINIEVGGTFGSFTYKLSSDPVLPESQIVTLIGGGIPDLQTIEQTSLRSSQEQQARMMQTIGLALLTSPLTSGVGSVFERTHVVDTVQITPLLSNETSLQNPSARLTLGRRISNRMYLTYSRTISGPQEEIILLEYDQNDRLSWVLSRNEDRTFALDFRIRYVF